MLVEGEADFYSHLPVGNFLVLYMAAGLYDFNPLDISD